MGMKPEYVLDEEGISQRFKYAKARTARGSSESGELEASSSSAEVTPSPLTSPVVSESQEQGPDSQQGGGSITEEVERLSPEPGSSCSGIGSVTASPSQATESGLTEREWPSVLIGPPINKMEVSPGRLWPIHQSPERSFHSEKNVSPRTDWFASLNQSKTNVRSSVSPVGTDWYPPPPETIIKEERDPVQPIRVSVIRSNPNTNTPIKIETPPPPPRLESRQREPCGREQGNFILPAPLPLISPPYYPNPFLAPPHYPATIQESSQNSYLNDVGLPVAVDLSSQQTLDGIIRMTRIMNDYNMMDQETRMKDTPADYTLGKGSTEGTGKSKFEEITEGVSTNYDEPLPDKVIEDYLHKKFRKMTNSNHEDMEDSTEELTNGVLATIPSKDNRKDIDLETNSPTSITSLLFQTCPIDTKELDLMFIDDLEKVFFKSWRQVNIGEFVMNAYMDFCKKKGDLDPLFFYAANLQFR